MVLKIASICPFQCHCGELSVGKLDPKTNWVTASPKFLPRLGWKLRKSNYFHQLSRTVITRSICDSVIIAVSFKQDMEFVNNSLPLKIIGTFSKYVTYQPFMRNMNMLQYNKLRKVYVIFI